MTQARNWKLLAPLAHCLPWSLQSLIPTLHVSFSLPAPLTLRPALLNSAENFTVLIKNNIDFPGHKYTT